MSFSRKPLVRRIAATVTTAGVLVLTSAGVASAHVTAISPDTLTKGGDAQFILRVPNEQDNASTVKLEVDFSLTSPLSNADLLPVPGWTGVVTMTHLAKPVKMTNYSVTDAVASIVWTGQPGTKINPGQFAEFSFRTEGLPTNTDELVMPTVQTYDNGDVTHWNQSTVSGKPEPDYPAPHVALGAADSDGSGSGVTASATSTTSTSDDTARLLGIVGIVVGVLGSGAAIGTFAMARRSNTPATASAVKQEASA
jgi:uncharacterized protein YcnI